MLKGCTQTLWSTPIVLKRLTAAVVAASLGFFALGVPVTATAQSNDQPYWQCVTFARLLSGIQIFGDAWTWGRQAVNNFRTGEAPEAGSVLVFQPHGRMSRGHVAVVSDILTERVIRVTHANWGGSRGRVEENVTVVDVSAAGDWSRVKVWYNPINGLGSTVYPTYGFIYRSAEAAAQNAIQTARAGQSQGQP